MPITSKNIVTKILELSKKIDSDWTDDLYELGIYNNLKSIYEAYEDNLMCNSLVVFVVMAYSNESNWIVTHHDRTRNKYDILKKIGLSEDELKKSFWADIINRENVLVNHVCQWFLDWQQDSRFNSFVSMKEYYSENISFVNKPLNPVKEVIFRGDISTIALSDEEILKAKTQKGKLLSEALAQETAAMEIYKSIENDFVVLDAISRQEDAPKFTDSKKATWEGTRIPKR